MAISRNLKSRSKPRYRIILISLSAAAITFLFILYSSSSSFDFSFSSPKALKNLLRDRKQMQSLDKYLYWGDRIDCPGKHCDSCEGLGHQESSLRCALEEALFLQSDIDFIEKLKKKEVNEMQLEQMGFDVTKVAGNSKTMRTFVMPSRMCINPIHNKKGILHQSDNASSEERWAANSCSMDSLYDLDLISDTVPVILDNSKMWYHVLLTSMKLGNRGVAHVEGVDRVDLKESNVYSNLLLINRTASPLSWFMECKDRNNRSAITLPYSFLPSMAAKTLRDVADQVKGLLGDYDAIHVRRGDKIKTRKDRFGLYRTLHPHLDRDTRPEFILLRIKKWIPPGRTLFIASNERTPGFFSPLSVSYNLAYPSNYSNIIDPVVKNNYQLFMIERLILRGAKTFVKTFKEDETDLSLTDDPKKNTKKWQIPVYSLDDSEGT